MDRTGFENLRVYQLAEEIADLTWEVVMKLGRLAQMTAKMASATDNGPRTTDAKEVSLPAP